MIKSIEQKTKTEQQVKKDVKKEFKFLASGKMRKGLKIFGLNPDTMEVYEVEIVKNKDLNLANGAHGNSKAYLNPNHHYDWSLNKKNAEKKLPKNYNQIKEAERKLES